MRRSIVVLCSLTLLGAACGDDDTGTATTTTSAPSTTEPTTTSAPAGDATTTTTTAPPSVLPIDELQPVVGGLDVPWDLAFVDDDTFLITERTGAVRVVEGGRLREQPALTVDAGAEGEQGLLGLALHPGFPDARWAYLYYTAPDGNRVSRFRVGDDLVLTEEHVLLDGIPASRFHDGGRIAFGPDGHLYVTTGDAQQPELAPRIDSLAGKILRIAADGSIPDDNPFAGSPVWSYGHRNAQGLAWTADRVMYASEHGPTGDLDLRAHDELNRIEPGRFYGWPYLAGTVPAAGGQPPAEPVMPVASSGEDVWAPAGLVAVDGPDGPSLLVAGLRSEAVLRFDVTDAGVVPRGVAADGLGRLRIAAVGPDGCLYLGTSNTDGRGDPRSGDDQILRSC